MTARRTIVVRRLVLLLLIAISGGAIVNVAVAWGIAVLLHPMDSASPQAFHTVTNDGQWVVMQFDRRGSSYVTSLRSKSNPDRQMGLLGAMKPVERLPVWAPHVPSAEYVAAQYPFGEGRHFLARGLPALSLMSELRTMRTSEQIRLRIAHSEEARWAIATPWMWSAGGSTKPLTRTLPLKPLWPGFAINTIFHTAILWLLFAAPFVIRKRRRIKRGLCPACAYPVGASELCTECGARLRNESA